MKRIIVVCLAMLLAIGGMAQSAKIVSAKASGYIANVKAGEMSGLDLLVNVGVEYSKISDNQASCVVVMNNAKLPLINTAEDLLEACQKLSYYGEDMPGSTFSHKEIFSVAVPLDPERVSGQEKVFYVQAFVMYDEFNPRLLAKSEVLKVDAERLTVLETRMPQEELQNYRDVVRSAISLGADAGIDAMQGRSANGQIRCSVCEGTGRVEVGTGVDKHLDKCSNCKGTGLMDDPTGDNHSSADAPTDFFETYNKARDYRMKQAQKNNSSKRNR